MVFWVILGTYKITFELKETWKKHFVQLEKHERDNNKPQRNKDG